METINYNNQKVTILYVDDEETPRNYFMNTFGDDYHVLTAESAPIALKILEHMPDAIDVLVTDYCMPGQSGSELLFQAAKQFPNVVRVIATAFANKDVLLESVNSGGVFHILEKPFDPIKVETALSSAKKLRRHTKKLLDPVALDNALALVAREFHPPMATIADLSASIRCNLSEKNAPLPERDALFHSLAAIEKNVQHYLWTLSTFIGTRNRASQLISVLLDSHPRFEKQRHLITMDILHDFVMMPNQSIVILALSAILRNALLAIENRHFSTVHVNILDAGPRGKEIQIADSGPGIPQEVLDRVFSTKRVVSTTYNHLDEKGHSLSLCNSVITSLGGEMYIHTHPKEGTVVAIHFPAEEELCHQNKSGITARETSY